MSAHLNTRRHVVAMIRATPSAAAANHAPATLIVPAVRVLPDVVYQLIVARVALHVQLMMIVHFLNQRAQTVVAQVRAVSAH